MDTPEAADLALRNPITDVNCWARAEAAHVAAAPSILMNSRRLIAAAESQDRTSYPLKLAYRRGWGGPDVRFGSKADMCGAKGHVRFTPDNDHESGFPHKVMSALPPRADMCSALAYVCFGPKADIA